MEGINHIVKLILSIFRLIRLDLKSGKAEVILSELNFANGVQIHPDRESVLISECSRAKIIRLKT